MLDRTWVILGLEVKDCQRGKGVFALRAFKKGELVSILQNQVFVRSTQSKGYAQGESGSVNNSSLITSRIIIRILYSQKRDSRERNKMVTRVWVA